MDQEKKDFFISYTGADLHWAEWIAWQLEDAGYSTILQAWDFHSGSNFVQNMQKALVNARRTITVLSPRYLTSAYAQAEWSAVFAEDPTGEKGMLIPVRIETCELQGLHKAIVYIDLVRKDNDEAKSFLLEQVELVIKRKRQKPDQEPNYPGEYKSEPRFPGALPEVWNLPRRNPNFTGRDQILKELCVSLNEARSTALTQHALHGLGGIGKSQLAIEYAYRHNTSYDYAWWIHSEDDSSLITDYTALAKALNLPEKDVEEQEVIIQEVRHWLDTHNGWLLIFDNARDETSIRDYLPQASSGHVLITSRNPYWTTIGTPLNIDVWNRDESIAFLKKRTGQDDENGADALAEVLGDLPLALEQAAAYIETKHKSINEYQALFNFRRTELWNREQRPSDYPDTVATTWIMAFDAVQDVPLAKDLLLLCSIVAPDDIPKSLVTRALEYAENNDSDPVAIDSFDLDNAIAALYSYSLITSDTDTFTIHRLVQAVVKGRVGNEGTAYYRNVMLKVLCEQFPGGGYNNPSCWPACEQLLSHAERLTEEVTNNGVQWDETSTLLNNVGSYYYGRALYAKAEPLLRRALKINEKVLGSEHPHVATNLNNLALLLKAQGKNDEAELLYRRVLRIDERSLAPEHPSVATNLNNLAGLLYTQGKYVEAEPLFRRALKINEKVLGPEHPSVATSLDNLALLLQAQGKNGEAEQLYRRALSILEKQLAPEHPSVGTNLNNLAGLLYTQGKNGEAEQLYRRALSILEKQLGPEHPSVATSLNNLALLLQAQGKNGEAKQLYRRALEINEKALGSEHPSVATSLNNLALLLQAQGKNGDVEPLYRRALKIREIVLGTLHPFTIRVRKNLERLQKLMRKK